MNYLRDRSGIIIGSLETRGTKTTIKDKLGTIRGTYDSRDNYTRNNAGSIVSTGNQVTSLI